MVYSVFLHADTGRPGGKAKCLFVENGSARKDPSSRAGSGKRKGKKVYPGKQSASELSRTVATKFFRTRQKSGKLRISRYQLFGERHNIVT